MIKNELKTAIFYTCGICNLNCKYCGIDKNPILKKIDDALGESFSDNGEYYFA
jgi:sulfatase maturation enzyme AslB (radical SAM superfamily)